MSNNVTPLTTPLREDLATPDGASLVAYKSTTVAQKLDALEAAYDNIVSGGIVPINMASDGDILEYDENLRGWVAKNDPNDLIIDGGNF